MAGAGGTRMRYATLCVTMSLVEVRKTNALSTSRESLQIVVQYPQQSYALRRTDEMLGENITSADQTHVLFDYEATIYLTDLSRRLLKLPPPAGLREEMAEHEGDARLIMARLTGEVAALESGLVSAAKDFTQAELTQIRRMKNVADSTRRKLFDLLKETTGSFIRQNQEPGRRAPMLLRDAMGLFAFRYSLCMLLYYMEWVRIGRQTGKKLPLRVNDVVDMQLAAMGTFFNGVLSADENLQIVSNTARGVLRGFGAYVGGLARAAAAAGERRRRGRCKSGRSGLDRSHMRFLANGPSIPDDLLIARDAGDVIFFCGAGVSRHRAGLPDFLKLGGDVIDLLGAGQKSLARKLFRRIKELEPIDGVGGAYCYRSHLQPARTRIRKAGCPERRRARHQARGQSGPQRASDPDRPVPRPRRHGPAGHHQLRPAVRGGGSQRSLLRTARPARPPGRRLRRDRASSWARRRRLLPAER